MDLHPFHITRPYKVRWNFPEGITDPLIGIKSKTLRRFLRSSDQLLAQKNITRDYGQVDEAKFLEWLKYYEQKMTENGYKIIASLDWYQQKKADGHIVEGVFYHQFGKLVCSGIFSRQGNEMASFAFKASDRIELSSEPNSSIGAVADYFFLQQMTKQGVKHLSAGRSTNQFGVTNSLGYLDYKLRFGYEPIPAENSEVLESIELSETGVVAFYGFRDNKWCLFALKPIGSDAKFEFARFGTPELPFIELTYTPEQASQA